jgi:CHAD domain-containing protein
MTTPEEASGINPDESPAGPASQETVGLPAWMERVAAELERARRDLTPDAVHDLRVALRRCVSIADIHTALDPFDVWGEMRKTGRKLFKHLGDLRDVQIMRDWIGRLVEEQDQAGIKLEGYLSGREAELRERAARAVAGFNRKKWRKWQERLAKQSLPLPPEDPVFYQFALERWQAAHDQHRRALRNRSHISYHRLRISLKRFRYTVENFLPQRHQLWSEDLKLLQDRLGEIHDLFILWRTALKIGALADREVRSRWRTRIEEESRARLLAYRSKAIGKESLWPVWRAGLPGDHALRLAAENRIRIWASYRDPDFARTLDAADLALQLLQGLESERIIAPAQAAAVLSVLQVAAIMYNVCRAPRGRKAGKSSYRQIRKTEPPLGFPAETYALAALAARYRRGTLGRTESKHLALLSEGNKQALQVVAAILHLANALAGKGDPGVRRLEFSRFTDVLSISFAGYREGSALARQLAAARHPLEIACHTPILFRPAIISVT